MNEVLSGTYHGKTYRLKVECYSKTAEIKVQLLPTDGSDRITITQNLGQPMPFYQAYLADGILDPGDGSFMAYMERNGLGHIVDYKQYHYDVVCDRYRSRVAVFQFSRTALRSFHPTGCARYETQSARLKRRLAERRARRMAG